MQTSGIRVPQAKASCSVSVGRIPHLCRLLESLTCTAVSKLIVTMDGPSGTGKSTVSKAVAKQAGLPHLDTGAFYRAATLAILRSSVDMNDEASVSTVIQHAVFDQIDGLMSLDGHDVSDEIRGEAVTGAVSRISAYPSVRKVLVQHQRRWVDQRGGRAVVEGRDIGSVVFPDASLKIYLDARPDVRARRRAQQTGEDVDQVLADITRRDHHDSTREASPLTVADGAIRVDTSDLTLEEVVDRIVDLIDAKS